MRPIPASLLALLLPCTALASARPQGDDQEPSDLRLRASAPTRVDEAVEGVYLKIYDVRDLALPAKLRGVLERGPEAVVVDPADDAEGVVLDRRDREVREHQEEAAAGMPPSSALSSRAGAADEGVRPGIVAWRLLGALLQSKFAGSGPAFSCKAEAAGMLVVRARQEEHDRIRDLLAELRRPDPDPIEVKITAFALDARQRAFLAQLENPHATDAELAVAQIRHVDPLTIERMRAEPIAIPTIVTLPMEPFELCVGSECSYIERFDLLSIEGIGRIADPVVKTVLEGLSVRGRVVAPAPLDGSDPVFALRLEVESTVLRRPLQTVKTDLGEIQLPEIKHATITTTVAGDPRSTFLVGGVPKPTFDPGEHDLRLYLLVTVRAPAAAHGGPRGR